jgi:hypothetical protein
VKDEKDFDHLEAALLKKHAAEPLAVKAEEDAPVAEPEGAVNASR